MLEKSFKATAKLRRELPSDIEIESIRIIKLSTLLEDIHAKTQEASQNTDLDMREILMIEKASQTIQGELANNTSKLTEIKEQIQKDSKKLKEDEYDLTYSEEQLERYKDSLENLKTERQARLEILSKSKRSSDGSCKDPTNH